MNIGVRYSLFAIFLLFIGLSGHQAMAQQAIPSCPLAQQANRTVVSFNPGAPLVASSTLAEALAGPVTVSLPTGVYDITVVSYDAHSLRQPFQNQPEEQFYLRLGNGQTTNRISDLPESADTLTEVIDSGFAVTSDVTSVVAQHGEYPDPGVPNSIYPICAAFDDVTPTPSPSPTPTPSPTPQADQGGGEADEADCCPGKDPEPATTPEPKVAGTQDSSNKDSDDTTNPLIAGAISNFPSAGQPLTPTMYLVLLLLALLVLWPVSTYSPAAPHASRRSAR